MDFSKNILREHKHKADNRLIITGRTMIFWICLVLVLNLSDVFILDNDAMIAWTIVSCIVYFIPTLYYNILKKEITPAARFIYLTILVVHAGLQVALLSYHTIIMLLFPLIASCLYNRRAYVTYTTIISIPMIWIGHFLSAYINIVPNEPLREMVPILLHGALPRTIEFLAIAVICRFISGCIEHLLTTLAEKNRILYEDQENLILSLSQIIENKSEDTGQHVRRVAAYTYLLCKSLDYSQEESWKISRAAMLHDVGKIMIPETILEKPGKLTPEEFAIVKKHTEYGKLMLIDTPGELFKISTEIAQQHHERWDGNGYIGLKGDEIATYALCVSLADVFDALVSKRSYKHAWTPQEAYDEIVSQKGRQFAPFVVDAFIENFDKFVEITKKYPDEEKETI